VPLYIYTPRRELAQLLGTHSGRTSAARRARWAGQNLRACASRAAQQQEFPSINSHRGFAL